MSLVIGLNQNVSSTNAWIKKKKKSYHHIPSVRNSVHSVLIREKTKWIPTSPSEWWEEEEGEGMGCRQVDTKGIYFLKTLRLLMSKVLFSSWCFSTCHHWAAPADHESTEEGAGPNPVQQLTFEARHLLALGLAEERQLIGNGFQHLHEVGQKEDDLDIVVGQVPSTTDALSPLYVRPTQQGHCGPLVNVFGIQPGTEGKEASSAETCQSFVPYPGHLLAPAALRAQVLEGMDKIHYRPSSQGGLPTVPHFIFGSS